MSDQIEITELKVKERTWQSFPTSREFYAKPRIHFSVSGENILQNFGCRFDRPHQVYRQVLAQVLKAMGYPETTRCRWSQKAGCSCGCSPAFIVQADRQPQIERPWVPRDAYVTVAGVPQPVTERALDRVAQLAADPTIAGPLGLETRS